MDEDDLMVQKYSQDVKRKKLSEATLNHIFDFIKSNCPAKSGSPTPTLRQFINDEDLYTLYSQSLSGDLHRVCLKTFRKYKHHLKVRRVKSYWGQFDCVLCLQLHQLKPEWTHVRDVDKLNSLRLRAPKGQLRDLLYHRIQNFHSAINTLNAEITSNVGNFLY